MRIFLALICSFALASLAPGAQEDKKKKEKKGAQAEQVSKPGPKGGGKPAETGKPAGGPKQAKTGKPAERGKPAETGTAAATGEPTGKGKGKGKPAEAGKAAGAEKATAGGKATGAGKVKATGKPTEVGKAAGAGKATAAAKPFKPQKFNLPTKTTPTKVAAVNFQQGKTIQGSQNWQGSNYQVFRSYKSEWHDSNWWHSHSNNVVFIFGGWYALNAGWWYPAWGYAPNAYYAYDGPIYAYNNLPPDQVIANVQTALQEQGYYHGEVDGLLGPLTREAIAGYQRDHGLYETAAIDQPTLESLGMS